MQNKGALMRLASFLVVTLSATIALAEESDPDVSPAIVPRSVDFQRDVRPILSNHCFACHGPDAEHREAGLRLDVDEGVDLDEVLYRITSDDPDLVMPPPEMKKPLEDTQRRVLQAWIEDGGPYAEHWSFTPLVASEPPEVFPSDWNENPIDRFVKRRLDQEGLTPSPSADPRTLLRRLHLDLTGLPPRAVDVRDFAALPTEQRYQEWVERLLADDSYGEHQTRFWLDLVRFADTNGLHHDHYREMTPYRDWVIRAFNQNLPYDEFVRDQIAGDLHDDATLDQQVASGFNRLHLVIDRGTALPEESFMRNVVDQVTAVGVAFMGLTVQCAVCHDHKYDPITQKDFYQLYAFFNNFDGEPETGGRSGSDFKRGLQPPYLELPSTAQARERADLEVEIGRLAKEVSAAKQQAKRAKEVLTEGKEGPESQVKSLEASLQACRADLDRLLLEIPATLVMKERSEIRPAHIMVRGVYDQPGERVQRDVPGFLPPLKRLDGSPPSRLDLANWLVNGENPLTARVAVNRFWQSLFGVGLVKTSEDFGAQGDLPSHPELLDYLAREFVKSGWDVKHLFRLITTSKTYQQSSAAKPERFLADPDNRMLARGSRYRLDAEVIRDQILALSGRLNRSLYGKSVKPPQPPGLWESVTMPFSYPRTFQADVGGATVRRSLYTFWKRGLPPPQLTILDAPIRDSCVARRERTNTPLQALLLMNESSFFESAIQFAFEWEPVEEGDLRTQLSRMYEAIVFVPPSGRTVDSLELAHDQFVDHFRAHPDACGALLAQGNTDVVDGRGQEEKVHLAALAMTAHALMNLDVTRTRW
ncbi:MAG: DUF1553 domain-containing protein [Planctomycetota bacterium]